MRLCFAQQGASATSTQAELKTSRATPPSLTIPEANGSLGDRELPVSLSSPNGYAALSDSYLSPGRESPPHSDGETY